MTAEMRHAGARDLEIGFVGYKQSRAGIEPIIFSSAEDDSNCKADRYY